MSQRFCLFDKNTLRCHKLLWFSRNEIFLSTLEVGRRVVLACCVAGGVRACLHSPSPLSKPEPEPEPEPEPVLPGVHVSAFTPPTLSLNPNPN